MKRRYRRFTVAFSVALLACGLFDPDETPPLVTPPAYMTALELSELDQMTPWRYRPG